jgi:hypothetical protein
MNRWAVRREWCMGPERAHRTLQSVTTIGFFSPLT